MEVTRKRAFGWDEVQSHVDAANEDERGLDAYVDEMTRLATDAECNDASDRMVGHCWDY